MNKSIFTNQILFKLLISTALILAFMSAPFGVSAHNYTNTTGAACETDHYSEGQGDGDPICVHGSRPTGGSSTGSVNGTLGTIEFPSALNLDAGGILNSLVTLIMAVAGLIFFFLLLYGGIRYMTAGGDPKNAESARKIITNAMIGLLIVVGAYFITAVLGRIFGIDFLNTTIPGLD